MTYWVVDVCRGSGLGACVVEERIGEDGWLGALFRWGGGDEIDVEMVITRALSQINRFYRASMGELLTVDGIVEVKGPEL